MGSNTSKGKCIEGLILLIYGGIAYYLHNKRTGKPATGQDLR